MDKMNKKSFFTVLAVVVALIAYGWIANQAEKPEPPPPEMNVQAKSYDNNIPTTSEKKKAMNEKEKIARGVPNPEFGCIYLYCRVCKQDEKYSKFIPKSPDSGRTSVFAVPPSEIILISYDTKDPRDLYRFMYYPGSDANTIRTEWTNKKPIAPTITPVVVKKEATLFYIEIKNTTPGNYYGVESSNGNLLMPIIKQN